MTPCSISSLLIILSTIRFSLFVCSDSINVSKIRHGEKDFPFRFSSIDFHKMPLSLIRAMQKVNFRSNEKGYHPRATPWTLYVWKQTFPTVHFCFWNVTLFPVKLFSRRHHTSLFPINGTCQKFLTRCFRPGLFSRNTYGACSLVINGILGIFHSCLEHKLDCPSDLRRETFIELNFLKSANKIFHVEPLKAKLVY